LGVAAALVQPGAGPQQTERHGRRHERPHAFADPSLRDPQRQQQRQARDDRSRSHPGKDAPADELLQIAVLFVLRDHRCLLYRLLTGGRQRR
jgi:hypothetical protein